MGWAIGFIDGRDVGYGVPAECDHPRCHEQIDRGLAYICGGGVGGGEHGCGLFFCDKHLAYAQYYVQLCSRCRNYRPPFDPKPDVAEWIEWKLTDESWAEWRRQNAGEVARLTEGLR